jgi:hypothetical protein
MSEHLRALALAATKGPWMHRKLASRPDDPGFVQGPKVDGMPYACEILGDDYTGVGDSEQHEKDCAYVAAANPAAILALLDELEDSHKAYELLFKECGEIRKDAEWVPCANKMPPRDGRYLVWFGGDCIGIAHTFTKWKHQSHPLGYLIQGHGGSHNDVTHWKPLPEPPDSAAKGESNE